ncbi:MAG: cytochrome-c oxidase, cbb3-type subunit III [Gammaproteobacteria bacterium]|nr:cytochrome-c oxidase, cbb3-type subunit III [Gammaproteobacteria bacterium]
MTGGASLFVIVFTILNITACLWLIWWTSRHRTAEPDKQQQAAGTAETMGHVWDGDLEEYNNPLPRWWLGLFIISVVFAAIYLTLYPGLGNFSGLRGWSQVSQYEQQVALQREKLEARLAALKDQPLEQLARDPEAMATARNLFAANCSTCHGSDARGARGFPNLTDDDWLWGGEPERIYESIAYGRQGVMPALGSVLGESGVNEVASYVLSLSGGKAPEDWVAAGKKHFETLCAACHGMDARGNQTIGAPNLTDDVWLYGRDFDTIRTTVRDGRENQMPAHLELLGEAKVKLLTAYVMSLNSGRRALGSGDSEEPLTSQNEHEGVAETEVARSDRQSSDQDSEPSSS